MADLVRQHGDIQEQLAYMDEKGPSESMMTVSATISGSRLISGNAAKHWEDSTLTGHIADLRAPQAPNFESQSLLPIMRAARESGTRQGLTIAEGRRSKSHYAAADVQNRSAQLQHQTEEANNHFSARASNTAVADGLLAQRESALAGRERHLEATLAQPQERKARIGALEARLAAWGAATRPDGGEFPLPGEGRQMHPRTGPKMAQRHHPTTSV
uniref:TcC31.11 n=1 Tax=Trypanosoma cruzi TaxID=5693 RepID=Q8I733_TRYCR|nr:TcC31.11 [Trypanosoma cruzi]